MRETKPFNPFYAALVVVGVAFALTACAYGVMTVRGLNPRLAEEGGLIGLMDRHGLVIMVVEIGLLGLLTVAAIATDGYWTRRMEKRESGVGSRESGIGGDAQ
jgi:hypothetical protein